jgi:hypothetical protein
MRKGPESPDTVFQMSVVIILVGLALFCIGWDLPRVEPAMFGSP